MGRTESYWKDEIFGIMTVIGVQSSLVIVSQERYPLGSWKCWSTSAEQKGQGWSNSSGGLKPFKWMDSLPGYVENFRG